MNIYTCIDKIWNMQPCKMCGRLTNSGRRKEYYCDGRCRKMYKRRHLNE